MIIFLGANIFAASVVPWRGNADSLLHMDYIYQVSQGQLPVQEKPMQYEQFMKIQNVPIQYVSQHPPLYYALGSIFAGGSLNSGQWQKAVKITRILNIFIGLLCVLAFAWAGWIIGGSKKEIYSLAVASAGAFALPFVYVTSDVMNDSLMVLMSIISLALCYKILILGPTRKMIMSIAVVSSLGMASRSTFITILFANLLAVLISHIYYAKNARKINVLYGIARSYSVIILFIIIAIGWFYLRNYKASGSFFQSGSSEYIKDQRIYKNLSQVLADIPLYSAASFGLLGPYVSSFLNVLFAFFILAPAILFSNLKQKIKLKRLFKDLRSYSPKKIFFLILLIVYLMTLGTQILHAWGYGQYSARYFLPAILPFSLLVGYSLISINRLRGQLVVLYVIFELAVLVAVTSKWLTNRVSGNYNNYDILNQFVLAITKNNLPSYLIALSLVMVSIGLCLLSISLLNFSEKSKFLRV